jgi:protein-S-isoprenylcysteine O-methyltransferase Ste14
MILIGLCVLILFTFIALNFLDANKEETRKNKKSFVETGTMTLFFIIFYLVIRFDIGIMNYEEIPFRLILLVLGTIVIIFGTYINIKGRLVLGKNWANQIKIYKEHYLVKEYPYNLVRHPLYASLIWMFYAASMIYLNWLAFLLNSIIFVPMMIIRAKQEEKLLEMQFKQYAKYQAEVGMFFPKI